jgi:hypothetical protein
MRKRSKYCINKGLHVIAVAQRYVNLKNLLLKRPARCQEPTLMFVKQRVILRSVSIYEAVTKFDFD